MDIFNYFQVGVNILLCVGLVITGRQIKIMRNRIKMTDIRLGKEHEVSLELSKTVESILKMTRGMACDIDGLQHQIDNLDNYLLLQMEGESNANRN